MNDLKCIITQIVKKKKHVMYMVDSDKVLVFLFDLYQILEFD